jgi:hypothetical protein
LREKHIQLEGDKNMKSLLDGSFKYTPVKDQGPDYLKRKFDKIRREQQANLKEQVAKVKPMRRPNGTLG